VEPFANQAPLVAIVGETASGKSSLALDVATQLNGEIICADSRTVYKGMDIGTAKPSFEDRKLVPHHLLDVIEPDKTFTAADFKKLASEAIKDITGKGKLPIMAGGTGLYVDSVLYDFEFGKISRELRTELEKLTDTQLQERAEELGISIQDVNFANRRHLSRAIERGRVVKQNRKLRPNTIVLGIKTNKEELAQRVQRRLEIMLNRGWLDEVRSLAGQYGWGSDGLSAIGYKEWQPYFKKQQSQERTIKLIHTRTMQYAKRQRTWFKRNKSIHWIDKQSEAIDLITTFLNN
jgi:tRNA dimethylallyltransferase